MKQKVLWFSRHAMTEEQKNSLGDVEINQINKTIHSAKELKAEIEANDKFPYGKPQTDEVARGSGTESMAVRD